MATEKQVEYTKSLVSDLRIENMEWIANLTLTGNRRDWKIQRWIDGAMGTRDYENEIDAEKTVATYNTKLDEIILSIESMTIREASKAIDNLKNCIV